MINLEKIKQEMHQSPPPPPLLRRPAPPSCFRPLFKKFSDPLLPRDVIKIYSPLFFLKKRGVRVVQTMKNNLSYETGKLE